MSLQASIHTYRPYILSNSNHHQSFRRRSSSTLFLLLTMMTLLQRVGAGSAGRQLQVAAPPGDDTEDSSSSSSVNTQTSAGLIDLADLKPFDVQIARTAGSDPIQFFDLTGIVTNWMKDSYVYHLKTLGYSAGNIYAIFDTVILLDRTASTSAGGAGRMRHLLQLQHQQLSQNRFLTKQEQEAAQLQIESDMSLFEDRNLQEGGQLYTAQYKGAALFTRNTTELPVPQEVVQFIQESTFRNKTGLLRLLQLSSASGLGASVVDVNAFVNLQAAAEGSAAVPDSVSSAGVSSDRLQLIVIIAVVVAAVAFFFLLAAIWWAWRYDQRNREAYLVKNSNGRTEPTAAASEDDKGEGRGGHIPAPMSEIGGEDSVAEGGIPGTGLYPESVISEDISTSLSQYYRSGLANSSGVVNYSSAFRNSNHLSDAGSVSSMESYGYSLDGYAPSTAPSVITAERKKSSSRGGASSRSGKPRSHSLNQQLPSQPQATKKSSPTNVATAAPYADTATKAKDDYDEEADPTIP